MHEVIAKMLEKYKCRRVDDYVNALREIMQEIALLGLWRSKFFEKAAFYGGTAMRVLYGLDRFSEDIDFSLITPATDFDLSIYLGSLEAELQAFGFNVRVEKHNKTIETAVQSAFLKTDTLSQLLIIEANREIIRELPKGQILKIKLEIDTDPPSGFNTETKYLFQPIPFAVRTYVLADLFAGKMHAMLCRKWKNRVKGRDWYDFVWFVGNSPDLHLSHLEQRMRQSGHWNEDSALNEKTFLDLVNETISKINVNKARQEVEPFVKNSESLSVWSHDFFRAAATHIKIV